MTKIDTLRKINKNIVHDDGTIDSFERQLIDFMFGEYDYNYPFVISTNSEGLKLVMDIDLDKPLCIDVKTVIKCERKHSLDLSFVSHIDDYIRESCLAFESLTQETSIVFVLNRKSDTFELPYIAICRTDKKYGEYVVNQITSIYDKEKLESLIQRTYDANKKFYVNEKSRAFIKSAELQLPINLINALSTSYDKQCLTKSQVEQDLSKSKSYGSETQLDEYGMCLSNEMQMMIDGSYQHEYMMLGRLQQDCEYYLGYGQRSERNLWADTVQDHIHAMKRYYNQVPIKPEWLSYKDILRYEAKMTTLKSLDDLRDLLEAHDWKIYDGGTSWEIEQYSPAGEDFVFCIQHDKSLEKAVEQICEYAMNFDQEEHIAMWLEARTVDDNRMNVPSPSELVEDAKEIQGMLDELDYVLDNCTLMEKKQETDIELEEEMEDIEK